MGNYFGKVGAEKGHENQPYPVDPTSIEDLIPINRDKNYSTELEFEYDYDPKRRVYTYSNKHRAPPPQPQEQHAAPQPEEKRAAPQAEERRVAPQPQEHRADTQELKEPVQESTSKDSFVDIGSHHSEPTGNEDEDEPLDEPQTPITRFTRFWRQFVVVFFSPIFPRHRSIFQIIVEVIVPGLVTFIIFAAFTSGISWKQVYYSKDDNTVYNFPELTMETAISKFTEKHADPAGSILMFYTPVNDFTTDIMRFTIENLQLDDFNLVHRNGRNARGVMGAQSKVELVERALFHQKETEGHGLPIGVTFDYDEKDIDDYTKLPYNVNYSIMSFDTSIHETLDNYPFVSPPKSKSWLSPYITSGFIGLQHSVEQAFIRNVLEKQKAAEKRDYKKTNKNRAFPEAEEEDLFAFLDEEDNGIIGTKANARSFIDPQTKTKVSNFPMFTQRIEHISDLPNIKLQMFTYANFSNASFRRFVTFAVTIGLVVAYTFMSFFIVRQIVKENISGIKDLLQMHGLPHYIHWASLFFHALFFRAITSFLVIVAFRTDFGYGSISTFASLDVLFLMIWIHQISLTFMNFFIATWFKSPFMTGLVSISTGILSFCLPETFYGMSLIDNTTNYGLMVIFPNWCLRHMIRTITDHESDEKGIHWFNIMAIDYAGNKLSVGGGMLMLMTTGMIYFILAAYRDMTSATKLFPPTSKWYEFKEREQQERAGRQHQAELKKAIAEGRATDFEKPAIYEDPDPEKKCFVHIRHVSKRFGKHKVVLDSISMDIMHKEITVILGHTGSGKTPLMAILAGMMMPSSGYAIIKGHDTNFESKGALQHVGLCTQRLVSFNLLTVREHIILCYRLRGYSQADCDRYCVNLLQMMNLWAVRTRIPGRIKVDEMRRLDIALALVGSPEILLLDEPTVGLDPMCRREIWNILVSLKKQHTIIVTSNLVDEAEYLADRVALIAHGQLICFGSLEFLRESYDTGYFLKLDHIPGAPPIDKNSVMTIVRKYLEPDSPAAFRKQTETEEVEWLELPPDQLKSFADICDDIGKRRANLSIKRLSIKRMTLSDIFIKVCSSVAAEGNPADLYVRRDSRAEIRTAVKTEIPELPEKAERNHSRYFHIIALLNKRRTVFQSLKISSSLLYSFLPLFVVVLVVFQAKLFILPYERNPNRMLTLQPYAKTRAEDNLRLFYNAANDYQAMIYAQHLESLLHPYGVKLEGHGSIIGKLYEVLESDPKQIGYIKEQHMMAFELRRMGKGEEDLSFDFMGYFASGALHSAPIAVNIMNNVFLHTVFKGSDGRRFTITANNNPMPHVVSSKFESSCGITCILLAIVMSFTIAFISHSCILFPMLERKSGMKHLQLMCGVHPLIYWIATYIVDAIIMFIVIIAIVIIFAADYYQTFSSSGVLVAIWIVCTLYLMWSGMMYVYFMSAVMPKRFNGYNCLALLHLFIGIIPMIVLTILPPKHGNTVFFRNLLLYFVPPYTISSALHNFFDVASKRNICKGINEYVQMVCDVASATSHKHFVHTGHYISERAQLAALAVQDVELAHCCNRVCLPSKSCYKAPSMFDPSSESWHSPALLTDTLALFFQGFVYCGLVIMTERRTIQSFIQRGIMKFLEFRNEKFSVPRKSRDVYQESLAVHVHSMYKGVAGSNDDVPEQKNLACVDLTKSTTTKMIMKDFCLEVKSGQCVAILGGGGAGKSCIANMIAGKVMPTTGNCHINDMSLTHKRKDYLACIGYCPQQNYLFEELTGTQMLGLMGCLRGVPEDLLNTHVQKWLSVFGLEEVADDKCKNYAHGLRQRLGVAMAFIGGPDIILLDEPTSGVDPSSRERLWAVIDHLTDEGHTILFTTYSSDEAFALAEKVAVVAEGNMQCVGNPEQLQNKYDRGHTLTFKLKHELLCTMELANVTMTLLREFKKLVEETFTHIDLLDEHDDRLLYFLRDARYTLGDILRRAHYLQTTYDFLVQSYDVSESDIEDIFIFMTKKYHELDKPRKSDRTILDIIKQASEPPFLKQQHEVTNYMRPVYIDE
ncbi:unnamed protein product [Orchesella dallaii]|uniref:ABC transporter domain-containing protein n=1 Tax=Orchesella dallaii TaxID=48710 RepID=A0ABP1PQV5_9HEXA